MKNTLRLLAPLPLFIATFLLGSCAGPTGGIQNSRPDAAAAASIAASIAAEAPGDYYIGRRYFKPQFKVWGYLRKPGQPWSTAQLVMLNEKQKLAPDREANKLGSDNNYEYKLYGDFSGDKVYEPASNGFYPEFVLKNYELVSANPPSIFKSQRTGRASGVWFEKPE